MYVTKVVWENTNLNVSFHFEKGVPILNLHKGTLQGSGDLG